MVYFDRLYILTLPGHWYLYAKRFLTFTGCFTLSVFLMSYDCWCLWLFLTVSWVRLQGVIVVYPDYTHLLLQLSIIWNVHILAEDL